MQGILYALVPMFAWGSIGFVSNKIGGTPNQQTFGLTLGAFVFSIIIYFYNLPDLSVELIIFGILGGILWSIGQNNQFQAMKYMGVSVANPLSSGMQLVLGSLVGALVFGEWGKVWQILLGSLAIVILIIGFYFISKKDQVLIRPAHIDYPRGVRALIYSTFSYVLYAVLFNNIFQFDALTVIFPMSIGMMLGALAFSDFKLDLSPFVLKNAFVGFVWGIGNVFMLMAARLAGIAIAFSFSQLGVVISVLGGIFFLHEHKTKKEIKWISIGITLFIVGAILLGIVKGS